MLRKVLFYCKDFAKLLKLDVFSQFIDIFREEDVRITSAILILNTFVSKHGFGFFKDFNLAFLVFFIYTYIFNNFFYECF